MNEQSESTLKTCPRCGARFTCLHAPDCWCADYHLLPEKAERLQQEFNNCLCPQCLALYAEKKADGNSDTRT